MISLKIESLRGIETHAGLVLRYIKKGIIVIFIFALSSCSLVKPIEFKKINNFKIEENSGTVKITSNITLYNPNTYQFILDKADIDVFAEGTNLGKLQIPDTVIINKKADFSGDFIVEIGLIKLLIAGKNILPKIKKGDVEFELKGIVEADVLWMHKKFNVEFKEQVKLRN